MAFIVRHGKKRPPRALGVYDKKTGETEKLHKRCTIKVIIGEKVKLHQFVAPATRGYSEKDIEEILERIINYLDEKFPRLEFRQVDLLPNAYNFIAVGARQGAKDEAEKRNNAGGSESGVQEGGTPDRHPVEPSGNIGPHDGNTTASAIEQSGPVVDSEHPVPDDLASDVSFVRGDS